MSGDFAVQLATHLPDWSVSSLLRCSAQVLPVCECVESFFKFHGPDTHDLLEVVADILARICYEENASMEFQL